MLVPAFELLVVLASVVVLLYQGLALLFAAQMPNLAPLATRPTREWPRVSVIVPARNEAADLPGCLDDLIAQEYPRLDILVVDGQSTDATREVASARAPRVRLLVEPPLPVGWVGKSWACQTGAAATSGEWLLFSDADMRYHPRAVASAVDWAERERADLASLAARIEVVGFWEKLVMPFYVQMVLTYFRAPRVNRDRSSSAMANGQFLLVRRSAYDSLGGHAAIRDAITEDVRLAQEFRRAGRRLRLAWAPDLLWTRMYRDRREMAEGILKNIHGTRYSSFRQLGFLAGLVALFWLPLLVLPVGWLTQDLTLVIAGGLLAFALFAKHAVFARAVRAPAAFGLLYPVAVGFYLALVVRSIVDGVSGRPVSWKGRAYARETGPPIAR